MSGSSFPRPEHAALLRRRIEERALARGLSAEVVDRGLNHLKCQYKFALRKQPEGTWKELAIHFQVAERMQTGASRAQLDRIIDGFLDHHFAHDNLPANE